MEAAEPLLLLQSSLPRLSRLARTIGWTAAREHNDEHDPEEDGQKRFAQLIGRLLGDAAGEGTQRFDDFRR
jgi:hypothetical protein